MSEQAARELDQLTVARLTGAAWRHASGWEPTGAETAAAVRELREIVGDRGDLLAEVAGLLIGYYRLTAEEPMARSAAYYCIAAGAVRAEINIFLTRWPFPEVEALAAPAYAWFR